MNEPVWIVIPARYSSSRFPGKPLADLRGRPMILWVLEACLSVGGAQEVVVATDDERIAAVVRQAGGRVEMTASCHQSGTERVAEIARRYPEIKWFVNVQGDEPGIDPELVARLIRSLVKAGNPRLVVSAAAPLAGEEEYLSPHVVKVVTSIAGRALYFSRSPIPFYREGTIPERLGSKHLGIYGYSGDFLRQLGTLAPGRLAMAENLEQLNWLENGYAIHILECTAAWPGIDTPEELAAFAAAWPGLRSHPDGEPGE
ncbi:MAG: 3-deoxy-manno-octulosonate cytidylyltransferase [Deltaproteobacteria bacterium]|nr:3-deoxy-manno-octulosonate cytidylyltransferase [Deltaproteobacteria bacterium]